MTASQWNGGSGRPGSLILFSALLWLTGCSTGERESPTAAASEEPVACAEERAVLVPETGRYGRSVTQNEQAQAFFDQGLQLSYSYYFPEALASFDAALCYEPDNPMIHWGRALAIAANPNSRYGGAPDDPQGEGRAAVQRALELADDLPAVQRGLIETLAVLYDTDNYPDRDRRTEAFVEAATALQQRFPEDPEVAFLAADAIMLASPWTYFAPDGDPIGRAGEALQILEEGMAQHPAHPGLPHLHIHLLESSHEPERAESSADRLESLTPRAGHMVHMPGHIYMRLGRYEDAIATNRRSLAADRYFREQWGDRELPGGVTLPISARNHGGHARDFIHWAHLLRGDSERAISQAREAAAQIPLEESLSASQRRTVASYWMTLRAFGRWDELLALPEPNAEEPYVRGLRQALRGSALIARGNPEDAEAALEAVQQNASFPRLENQRASVNDAADLLRIVEARLQGELAAARDDHAAAIDHFQEAVAAQDQLRYMEPPDWLHSTRLYLGQAHLDAGEHGEAEAVFRRELESLQNNGWALFGLGKSLEGQGRDRAAQRAQARFREAWREADTALSAAHF